MEVVRGDRHTVMDIATFRLNQPEGQFSEKALREGQSHMYGIEARQDIKRGKVFTAFIYNLSSVRQLS